MTSVPTDRDIQGENKKLTICKTKHFISFNMFRNCEVSVRLERKEKGKLYIGVAARIALHHQNLLDSPFCCLWASTLYPSVAYIVNLIQVTIDERVLIKIVPKKHGG